MQIRNKSILFVISLLFLANCTDSSQATLASRNAPEPQIARAATPQVAAPDKTAVSCLAEAIYFEARGTGRQGAVAVAHVVQNRARHAEFPNSICGVIADRCQFSYRCDGNPLVYREPDARQRAVETAEAVLSGEVADPTGGALFFHSARVSPGWFNTRPRVGEFGGNVFYR